MSGLRFHPDVSTMALDNFLAQGQANPCPRVRPNAMQALEEDKDAVGIL
jgi:hypothetical protein